MLEGGGDITAMETEDELFEEEEDSNPWARNKQVNLKKEVERDLGECCRRTSSYTTVG